MKKSLSTSNRYLRKKTLKKEMVNRFIESSSAIEGISVKKPKKSTARKKSLIETNPYLKDPIQREKLVKRSVRTSCAVEGIAPKPENTSTIEIKNRTPKKIYKKTQK